MLGNLLGIMLDAMLGFTDSLGAWLGISLGSEDRLGEALKTIEGV